MDARGAGDRPADRLAPRQLERIDDAFPARIRERSLCRSRTADLRAPACPGHAFSLLQFLTDVVTPSVHREDAREDTEPTSARATAARRWFVASLGVAVAALVAIGGFNAYVDPFQQYRIPGPYPAR